MKKSSLLLGAFMTLAITVTSVSAMAPNPFTDVPKDHWAYQAIEDGRTSGLWEGYKDGSFGVGKQITREEVAMAMYRNNQMIMTKMAEMQKAMEDKMAAMEKKMGEMEKMMSDMDMDMASVMYMATLEGKQQVPAVETTASAVTTLELKDGKLWYTIEAKDLSGPVTSAHIHMGEMGKNGDPVHTITFNGMKAEGSWTPTAEELKQLPNKMFYINIHTAAHPDGEIRGQIMPKA